MVFPGDDTPFADDVAFAPGISLAADASSVHESVASASCFRRQVFDLAAAGLDLSVAIESASPGSRHAVQAEYVLELIAEAMLDAGIATHRVTVVTDSRIISPQSAWRLRQKHLGAGPLYVRSPQCAVNDVTWREAWELRKTAAVGLLCVPFVTSVCRLLPAELATSLVPCASIQGPPGTAWAAVEIDLCRVADSCGEIDVEQLDTTVRNAVAAGERQHCATRWPTARLRHDAWLNRRLAIDIVGIGALVRRRGLDPERFAALDEMSQLVGHVRDSAIAESQRIAAAVGHVPALEQANLANALPGGRLRDGWSKHWRLAVEATAVRHRNLLVISPWSLFPPGEPDPRFANLLPLLRFADTCAFGARPDLSRWTLRQFKGFHQQAVAVLQQRGAPHQIAVQA